MENSLFNVENYNKLIIVEQNIIIQQYISIINEYLVHACDNIVIPNYNYYLFVLIRGISSIKHIFSTLFLYTKLKTIIFKIGRHFYGVLNQRRSEDLM